VPETLSYQITLNCPIGADVRHGTRTITIGLDDPRFHIDPVKNTPICGALDGCLVQRLRRVNLILITLEQMFGRQNLNGRAPRKDQMTKVMAALNEVAGQSAQ
jgi:hypothetical protein